MKKMNLTILLAISMLTLGSCEVGGHSNSGTLNNSNNNNSSSNVDMNDVEDVLFDEHYDNLLNLSEIEGIPANQLMYDDEIYGRFPNRKYQEIYKNNVMDNSLKDGTISEEDDPKFLYYSNDTMRFVNRTDGYAFNIKTDTTYNVDFSLANYRSKVYNKESTITVTKENKNTYTSWKLYRDDWLIRYINNPRYLKDNNLSYTEDVLFEDQAILDNYCVSIFSIVINDPGNIRKNYYNIAVIRDSFDYSGKEFYLVVMKSTHNRNGDFKNLVRSFELIDSKGTPYNAYLNMELKSNENWSDETKAYFDKLSTQQRTDWGIYVSNLDEPALAEYKLKGLQESLDYNMDLYPTYLHTSFSNKYGEFKYYNANVLAGGNGFNGKRVLQLSYQFTNNNNRVSTDNTVENYTPMFDILRGPRDNGDHLADRRTILYDAFTNLTNGIKQYGKPMLFRLNNEMNSDWTSYCGMITLLDPDIFQATWRYLYNYFEENGVNNTIWIFNPNAISIPYSNWGEDMCYFPGNKYVQALGLTYYEANNDNSANFNTFRKDYTKLYDKNNPVWNNYPWIISEFACGSGGSASGELYRNQQGQANYVKGMFDDFKDRANNPYLQNIKGAVWFSANDPSAGGKIANQYELVIEKLPLTIEQLREGLKVNK